MKYGALVLRNTRLPVLTVEFAAVLDALRSGGVFLDEVALLPYDEPQTVGTRLSEWKERFGGVFVVCDEVLLPAAKEAVSAAAGVRLTGAVCATEETVFAVLPAGAESGGCVKQALAAVDERRGYSCYNVVIKTVGAPPQRVLSAVGTAREAIGDRTAYVHASEKYGVGKIELVYTSDTPKVTVDEAVRVLASELDEFIYAMEDVTVGERLFEALKLHRMHVATAESFTGGGVGREIVRNAGASAVFYEGLNPYDSGAKKARLGVTAYTLEHKGAVSEDAAYEMAVGLLKDGHCDVAIATTGYAGPTADRAGTPPGLCYIAVGTRERVRVCEYLLEGDRASVTEQAINLALFLAYREIK